MASVGTKCTELKKEKTNLSIDHAAERLWKSRANLDFEHHTSVAKSVIRQIMESSLYGTQAHIQIHGYFQKLGSLLS